MFINDSYFYYCMSYDNNQFQLLLDGVHRINKGVM